MQAFYRNNNWAKNSDMIRFDRMYWLQYHQDGILESTSEVPSIIYVVIYAIFSM